MQQITTNYVVQTELEHSDFMEKFEAIKAIQKTIGWDGTDLRIAERRLNNANDIKIFALFENQVVGYAIIVHESETSWYLSQIAVSEELQGKNIGSGLMHKILELAKDYGICKVTLDTEKPLEETKKPLEYFYKKIASCDIVSKGYNRFGQGKIEVTYQLTD